MNRKIIFLILPFFTISCFKSIKLPQDFEVRISVWVNLMPGPVREDLSKKMNGIVQFKGTFEEEIELKEVYILKQQEKIKTGFEKKESNYYILKDLPPLKPGSEIDFLIRFKYKNKTFEKEIKKIKVGAVY